MPNFEIQWDEPPSRWSLKGTEAHLWAAALDVSPERLSAYANTLSPNEHERAQRFRFERDQKHFIAGRGTLRAILGSYLKIKPAQLQFEYGSHGKPILANLPENLSLHFNLAHSDGLLLVAVSEWCPVGVDVERLRLIEKADDLAERFFSPVEAIQLRALPDHQRAQAFFNLWTRKEACLKATGDGITERLQEMAVSFLPDEPARVLRLAGTPQSGARWTLKDLNPAPEYVAAIAAVAQDLNLSCWRWSH
jgi:4'-phosphopantetheinyl transferase